MSCVSLARCICRTGAQRVWLNEFAINSSFIMCSDTTTDLLIPRQISICRDNRTHNKRSIDDKFIPIQNSVQIKGKSPLSVIQNRVRLTVQLLIQLSRDSDLISLLFTQPM